jgi:hypothetical protein
MTSSLSYRSLLASERVGSVIAVSTKSLDWLINSLVEPFTVNALTVKRNKEVDPRSSSSQSR